MGEAKRRRAIDPNYGKVSQGFARKTISLGIQISKRSGNYIVFCKKCGFWIDSASLEEDAVLVKEAVEKLAAIDPPKLFSRNGWLKWLQKYWSQIPEVDAKTWVVDPSNASEALESLAVGLHPADIDGAKEATFFYKELR